MNQHPLYILIPYLPITFDLIFYRNMSCSRTADNVENSLYFLSLSPLLRQGAVPTCTTAAPVKYSYSSSLTHHSSTKLSAETGTSWSQDRKVLISHLRDSLSGVRKYFITTVSDLTNLYYVLETGWHREKSKDKASILITGHSDFVTWGKLFHSFIYILATTAVS